MSEKPIYVTRPHLPPLEEYIPYLRQVWESGILTNRGEMHRRLVEALRERLGVPHIVLSNNGTNALLAALKALHVTSEVITTPYSFVATAHSLLWNGIRPVFVDIDPVTLNLDPRCIEAAITPRTSAIMPVHCYGNPCDTKAIAAIAEKHGLKVIYDAAHAFGVEDEGGSILRHGDLSVLSFHATKVFNTFEGGAIVCHDAWMRKHINQLQNFGFVDEVTVEETGINGKMNEPSAAFGLLQLETIDAALARRREIDHRYRERLRHVPGIRLVEPTGQTVTNCAYFPILVEDHFPISRDALYEAMRERNIFTRRYFYPLISDFPMYRQLQSPDSLPVARDTASRVLCLPIYPALEDAEIDRILEVVEHAGKAAA